MGPSSFLRLCINDSYNLSMGDVIIGDQLCCSYWTDAKWMQKMKWWHAHYYWGRGTDLVNVYKAYTRFHEMNGKTPITHYEFHRDVCLANISPLEYGSAKQRGSVPFQRGDHRGQPRAFSSVRYSSKRSVASTATTESVADSTQKSMHATAKRLEDPGSIYRALRLNRDLCHLPVPAGKNANCALCRWATGNQYRAQIAHCEACGFSLCIWCNKCYHTEPDLGAKKEEICAEILARKHGSK